MVCQLPEKRAFRSSQWVQSSEEVEYVTGAGAGRCEYSVCKRVKSTKESRRVRPSWNSTLDVLLVDMETGEDGSESGGGPELECRRSGSRVDSRDSPPVDQVEEEDTWSSKSSGASTVQVDLSV